ncbi:hypothetical protein MUCCIDRAFT_80496 [Mucor lusitanicus CBS 277.49]|uniref:Bud emergence protein 1 n=1 Tax=Mucor lusitanicus CBS 277.49 TaxID=747725 RepID=A0A162QSV9_MUCCL|nr:hypothetical protein MUCCIDRAFT_80496 [Mucor lusitanicus CBS 277.49]
MFLHKEKVKPPRSLRSARLSVVKNQISTPVIQTSTNSPKKVIKALYDYNAQSPNELSFARGDFFLVTGREGDTNFYEAFNPITNSRGIVPVPYFQVLEKHEKAMVDSVQRKDQYSEAQQPKPQPLYGIVLYDFQAERSDELDAKAGEPIIIIAQSNAEWFVAKPIGRLGGPGLIPVSFVDIRDASTGRTVKNDLMQAPSSSVFPNVEDWKKQTQGYEASSISIGKMERQMQQISIEEEEEMDPVDDYYDMKDHHQNPDALLDNYGMTHLVNTSSSSILDSPAPASSTSSRRGAHDAGAIVVSAYIDSHILEGDQYWFIVFAKLANGRHRVLYRLYEDFYDFQINFLQEFPAEAGKQDQARILPYMPGPLDAVNDDITADRARDLSKYCDDLLRLPRYLSESNWVQDQLFGIHEGDIETDIDPGVGRPASNSYDANQQVAMETTAPAPQPQQSAATATQNKSTIKVKIMYKDEIFAIKVPVPSSVEFLRGKVVDRLGFDVNLKYKSGDHLTELNTETFEAAVKLGKLTVVAS